MNTIIADNFFVNFENIKDSFKKFELFEHKEFNKKFNEKDSWPGFRSGALHIENPFLFNLILKEIFEKFGNQYFYNKKISVKSHIHLRLDKDNEKDWIHKDPNFATLIVFLSETNLKSGTCLYDENKNVTNTINFVQNRALLFNSQTNHKSLNNYGEDLQNGRLTLNCFIDLI
jgi:hypothetical protein